jgi:splicing factor 3A subunit 2
MVQLFLLGSGSSSRFIEVDGAYNLEQLNSHISGEIGVPLQSFYLTSLGGSRCFFSGRIEESMTDGTSLQIKFRIHGGIDFQHREGSKVGSGGQMSESQAALERKERLRKLALETIDISKDPYIIRNHLGTFECKLCLTLHNNEGNYLAHTQGKRHQVYLIPLDDQY